MKENDNLNLTPEQIKDMPAVPWVAHNALQEQYAHERKWHIIKDIIKDAIILAIVAAFLIFISSFDMEVYEVSADDNSNANYVGGAVSGDINNGGTSTSSENESEEPVESQGETDMGQGVFDSWQEENSR